jgi:hypothetical protein
MCRSLRLLAELKKHPLRKQWALDEDTGHWHCHNVCLARAGKANDAMLYPKALEKAVNTGPFDHLPIVFDHRCEEKFVLGYTSRDARYVDGRVYNTCFFDHPLAMQIENIVLVAQFPHGVPVRAGS